MAPKTKNASKRIRRAPEVLMKELDAKMKKLEERIYKKNKDTVHTIGTAILKRAKFDFSTLAEEDIESIAKMTERGNEIIRDIIEKAYKN